MILTLLEGSKKLNKTMTGAKNIRGFRRWKNIKRCVYKYDILRILKIYIYIYIKKTEKYPSSF